MQRRERFFVRLYARAEGRMDRTVHAHRHIGLPLGFSLAETDGCAHELVARGLVEADPALERLIRLTPRGVAAGAPVALRVVA